MPALYIHIPFCLSKCYYCDFVSAVYEEKLGERYTAALCQEASLWAQSLRSRPEGSAEWLQAPTVFLGGGTPTTLSVNQLGRILGTLKSEFGWAPDAEVTIEANPGTHVFMVPGKLAALRDHGVNRLSIGAQTFDDNLLKVIGRSHAASDVEAAVARARSEGFDNLSVDLIFALPGQSLQGWGRTLDRALALGTEHISLYNLTIEEGTVFGEQYRKGQIDPAPSDLEAAMYDLAISKLTTAGYDHYEVSNFALPGRRSRHNQVYWRREDYLGLGVGAHSCLRSERFSNGRNTLLHIRAIEENRLPTENEEALDSEEMLGEAMWLGLRLLDGLDLKQVARQIGRDPETRFREPIRQLLERGLLRREGSVLSLTKAGLFLGNEVFCRFVA